VGVGHDPQPPGARVEERRLESGRRHRGASVRLLPIATPASASWRRGRRAGSRATQRGRTNAVACSTLGSRAPRGPRRRCGGQDSSAAAQPRLWLTTSTLCPSGSSTNAP
jgi:hypothetical protein